MQATCEETNRIEAFRNINPESIQAICSIAKKKQLKKGEVLFLEKDRINKFYAVLEGKVSMSRYSEKGQKRVFFILGEGCLVNEVVFDDLPVSVVCEAFEPCLILEFAKNDFLKIMEKDFKLTMNILNSIGKKQRRLYRQLKNTMPIRMDKRLAAKLWKLSKDHGKLSDGWHKIDLEMSITYLSYMLGSNRETISRAMKVLADLDLVRWVDKKMYVDEKGLLAYYRKE